MSWTNELLAIYEYNCGRKFFDGEPEMLPIAHSTAKAQIEITVSEKGEFMGASLITDRDQAVTVIPATEDSATRSGSGAIPMPFDDKLIYIAGDYGKYAVDKDAEKKFNAYMNQLRGWCESKYSNKAVRALYDYLDKRTLMSDLVEAGVLKIDEATGKLASRVKIAGINQEDSFVRVIIAGNPPLKTWDNELCKKYGLDMAGDFIKYNSSLMGQNQLCYATGEFLPVTYKHPSKIRSTADKAKLFSANDESGFSYRGRFSGKEEAVSISYDFSQKIHNALRWLIQKQGQAFDSMTLVVWASALQDIPKPTSSCFDFDDEDFGDEDDIPTTAPMYMTLLKKNIYGYKTKLKPNTRVMLMGIDAATTGRASLSLYTELEGSDYLNNIEKWHSQTAWVRYIGKQKMTAVNSFGLIEIIKCALGTEKGSFIDCDKKILSSNVLRVLPCVTMGKKIPRDILVALYNKASNPLAYENSYNHRLVLETACGMIRKSLIDKNNIYEEDYLMAYDPDERNRSYLYGCLLAIADKAENEAFEQEERNKRQTDAKRYWNAFSQHPYQTWGIIEKNLVNYFNKLGKSQVKYQKRINEILDKMDMKSFTNNSRLENVYLLGYSHYTTKMFDEDLRKNKEEN